MFPMLEEDPEAGEEAEHRSFQSVTKPLTEDEQLEEGPRGADHQVDGESMTVTSALIVFRSQAGVTVEFAQAGLEIGKRLMFDRLAESPELVVAEVGGLVDRAIPTGRAATEEADRPIVLGSRVGEASPQDDASDRDPVAERFRRRLRDDSTDL